MRMTTSLCGRPEIIQDEFRAEVGELRYHVSDMRRHARDVADDLRAAVSRMVTALCMATAREFLIVLGDTGYRTLIVRERGPEGWDMSADSVEYARTFRNRGEAWGTLARILGMGDGKTVSDCPGNQAGEPRQAGALGFIIRALGEPGVCMVLDSSEPMPSSAGAFQLLFGGDLNLWEGGNMGDISYSIDGAIRDTVRRMIMLDTAYTLRSHKYSVLGGYNRLLGRLDMAYVVGAVTLEEYSRLHGNICRIGLNDRADKYAAEREVLADSCMAPHEAGGGCHD